MDNSEILLSINKIFAQVFKDPDIEINGDTTSDDIKNWDSLNNMILVVMIEDFYKIRFDLDEVQKLKNVEDLCNCVAKYLNL
jgi:acyl carrier protein